MVRQAIAGALPPRHRYPARVKPKLDAVAAFIDQVLDEDRRAPRKQRHTARRIYRRILTEFPDGVPPRAHRAFCSPVAKAVKLSPPSTTSAFSRLVFTPLRRYRPRRRELPADDLGEDTLTCVIAPEALIS